jgi:hypothetical protein
VTITVGNQYVELVIHGSSPSGERGKRGEGKKPGGGDTGRARHGDAGTPAASAATLFALRTFQG